MTSLTGQKMLLSLIEAAALTPFSSSTLRKAIRTTNPAGFPPPLRAKQDSKGRYMIRPADLQDWIDRLPDA